MQISSIGFIQAFQQYMADWRELDRQYHRTPEWRWLKRMMIIGEMNKLTTLYVARMRHWGVLRRTTSMMPADPKAEKAQQWLAEYTDQLQFEQDYYIFPGSSEALVGSDGRQTGISIKRPDIRLYETGIVKLYEMIVEGVEYPPVVYTAEQEAKFEENLLKRFPQLNEEEQPE